MAGSICLALRGGEDALTYEGVGRVTEELLQEHGFYGRHPQPQLQQ